MTCASRLMAPVAVALCAAMAAFSAPAQEYPTRLIRLVVGPGPDTLARLVAQKLTGSWGQQVLVDPRPAAAGIIAADTVAKAVPDGYTLLLSTTTYTIAANLYAKLPYDFVRDFAPVSLLATVPFLLLAHPSLPAKSVGELIALARARPGEINYASSGNGATAHLAGEMLKNMARIDIVHVPYKGIVEGITNLLGGQVQIMFASTQTSLPYARSGRLRALAVSGAKRTPGAPDVPTIAESGFPDYEVSSWNGVHVPVRTPNAVIARLHAELLKTLALPDVKERVSGMGMEPVGNTPDEFAAVVIADISKWGKAIRESGVRLE